MVRKVVPIKPKVSVVNSPLNMEAREALMVDKVDAVIEQTVKSIFDKPAEVMQNSGINTTSALFTEDGVEVHFRSELERIVYLHATQGEKAQPVNGYYIYEIDKPSMALRCYCHQRAQYYLSGGAQAIPNPDNVAGNFKIHNISKKYVCEVHAQVELGLFVMPESGLVPTMPREPLTPHIEGQKFVQQLKDLQDGNATTDNAGEGTNGGGNSEQNTATVETPESGAHTEQTVAPTGNTP